MNNFPYLNNPFFLKEFDKLRIKVQYLKINVLTFFDERVIAEISGDSLGGNISIDGSSAMRRTANLSMIVRDDEYSETNIKQLLGLNKKVEIFIGFKNTTGEYEDYPILWFPQGIYVIISQNISHGLDGTNISLTLHDKMALLNGECGGVLPASVVFS